MDIAKTLPMSKVTGRIRHTDLNIDGYPDIFITLEMRFKNSTYSSHYKKTLTLINVPCGDDHACPNGAERTRYFGYEDPQLELDLKKITELAGPNAVMIVPIDIDNDGRMDILVQKESDGKRGINEISVIYNNMFTDSFFIQSSMYSQNQVNERHSAIIGGATFRYIVSTLDDNKYIRVDTQLPQCSYQSLILPYVYNGIGRSNGYLESFNVAYSH